MRTLFLSLLGLHYESPEHKLTRSDSMPAPFHPVLIAATAVAAMASAAAGYLAQAVPEPSIDILENHFLTLMCLSGSLGGGIVSVLLYSTTESRRQQAAKFMVSGLTGMIVSPFLIHYMAWQKYPSLVLFCSGVVALLSWSILIPLVPWAAGVFTSLIQKKVDPNTPDKP